MTMLHVGSLKEKNANKATNAVRPHLVDGEMVLAVFYLNKINPTTTALVISNARLFAVEHGTQKVVREASRNEATAEVGKGRLGSPVLRVTARGRTDDWGTPKPNDVETLRAFLVQASDTSTERASEELARRSRLDEQAAGRLSQVIVGSVNKPTLEEIRKASRTGESPLFVLGTSGAGALAAFEDRCLIIKKGLMASAMAGSLGGGRVTTFHYGEITGVEYNSGLVSGVLEILTASYQGTANKDFWKGTLKPRNADANDPWTLSNTLPLTRPEYERARPQIDRLQQMVADSKRPTVIVQQSAPAPQTREPAASPLTDELTKLAALYSQGVLDEDEFREAKQALIRRH